MSGIPTLGNEDRGRSIRGIAVLLILGSVMFAFLPLSFLVAATLEALDNAFACPDEQSQKLLQRLQELKLECPDAYIATNRKLPTVRFAPVVHTDFVDDKLTGWVRVRVNIDESGHVTGARIESSTSPRLEKSASEAARRFRYQPVIENKSWLQ